jgi:hypothetical protein
MQDQFNDYHSFLAYVVSSGWVSVENATSVESALAAFESTQRRRGAEAARQAMDKAARKVW